MKGLLKFCLLIHLFALCSCAQDGDNPEMDFQLGLGSENWLEMISKLKDYSDFEVGLNDFKYYYKGADISFPVEISLNEVPYKKNELMSEDLIQIDIEIKIDSLKIPEITEFLEVSYDFNNQKAINDYSSFFDQTNPLTGEKFSRTVDSEYYLDLMINHNSGSTEWTVNQIHYSIYYSSYFNSLTIKLKPVEFESIITDIGLGKIAHYSANDYATFKDIHVWAESGRFFDKLNINFRIERDNASFDYRRTKKIKAEFVIMDEFGEVLYRIDKVIDLGHYGMEQGYSQHLKYVSEVKKSNVEKYKVDIVVKSVILSDDTIIK
jgi:hypothetical protein